MADNCFIMIDGIDGSGKSSVVHAWKEYLRSEGNAIFDLKEYWKSNNNYPEYHEFRAYDFVISHEPTSAGIGKVIREELVRNGTSYPPLAIAEAYALDRLVLYQKTILPALADGKCVISDRAVTTSLCYQPLTDPEHLTFDLVAKIPGNAFTLEHPPQHLILMQVDPQKALDRLQLRRKNDNAIFEKFDFLKKAATVYASAEYRAFFEKLGTKVHYLPADAELAIIEQKAIELLKQILSLK